MPFAIVWSNIEPSSQNMCHSLEEELENDKRSGQYGKSPHRFVPAEYIDSYKNRDVPIEYLED